jgi:type IV pilus assembly protein PilC
MLNAGLTLVDALDILESQTKKPAFKTLLSQINKQIKSGTSFSTALKKYPNNFSNLYIALVKSGEASGKLSDVLLRLADNLEKQRELRSKIKGAMTYPAIVVSAMVAVMFIMVTFVIPKMLDLYKDFDVELPLSTKVMMAVSSFTSAYWPLIIIFVAILFFSLKIFIKSQEGKRLFDNVLFNIPYINNVVKISALVDTTRTLSILISSGVSILDALNIIIDTTSNSLYKDAFKQVYLQIEKGKSLGNSLATEKIFPPILIQMSIVGESTGHLDDTLLRLSKYFEFESESAIKAMTTMIEPAILIVLGFGVGLLVTSVITPIYQLTGSLQ